MDKYRENGWMDEWMFVWGVESGWMVVWGVGDDG